jgi:hypothetical protein
MDDHTRAVVQRLQNQLDTQHSLYIKRFNRIDGWCQTALRQLEEAWEKIRELEERVEEIENPSPPTPLTLPEAIEKSQREKRKKK